MVDRLCRLVRNILLNPREIASRFRKSVLRKLSLHAPRLTTSLFSLLLHYRSSDMLHRARLSLPFALAVAVVLAFSPIVTQAQYGCPVQQGYCWSTKTCDMNAGCTYDPLQAKWIKVVLYTEYTVTTNPYTSASIDTTIRTNLCASGWKYNTLVDCGYDSNRQGGVSFYTASLCSGSDGC
jgi:hypothetical protein